SVRRPARPNGRPEGLRYQPPRGRRRCGPTGVASYVAAPPVVSGFNRTVISVRDSSASTRRSQRRGARGDFLVQEISALSAHSAVDVTSRVRLKPDTTKSAIARLTLPP